MKAIETKYLGPTNTKGSRIKATDNDGNSIIIPYDYSLDTYEAHEKAAKRLVEKLKWNEKGLFELKGGFLKKGYAFIFVRK